jgi:hypothetical protein
MISRGGPARNLFLKADLDRTSSAKKLEAFVKIVFSVVYLQHLGVSFYSQSLKE